MFQRTIYHTFKERLQQFPVIALTGPRQSGKTTFLQNYVPHYSYLNLESPDQLQQVQTDPKGTLATHSEKGLVIDEAQKYPELFSYIQVIADQLPLKGRFILSGSQNFLLSQHLTQSLAGRVALLELLPLTHTEYQTHPHLTPLSLWEWLYHGGYPRPYQDQIPIKVWLDNYVRTYIERDVRDLLNIRDLNLFQRFLRLCAGRHGQILNLSELATDVGVSHTTIAHWLSVLEASYLIFRLPPYYQNFSKRLIKSSKLYFYDSGLVCYLLGIDSLQHLSIHSSRGAIFEGYIISEIKKYFYNLGITPSLYFWRDSHGQEIDCLLEYQGKLLAIEIKATSTFRADLLKGMKKWQAINQDPSVQYKLIYAGEERLRLLNIDVLPWQSINQLFKL